MKKLNIYAGLLVLLATTAANAEPVSRSEVWTQVFPVSTATPKLVIDNIWGNVRVRPGTNGQISVTVDEHRSAPSEELFERSLATLGLVVAADDNGLSLRVGDRDGSWQQRDTCPGCRVDYQFEVLVPRGTIVDVGTVTDGGIDVAGIAGKVSARNVNGPIKARDVSDCTALESVNGQVDLGFTLAPGQDCSIETINGDITLTMPDGTGLDVALDLFNGDMISEFNVDPFALPARVETSQSGGKYRYRIQQSAGVRVEGGGPRFSISSLNGDIRIQKNQ